MKTEGVKYMGAKTKIIPHILKMIEPLGIETVLDGFSGSTRVAQAFKLNGFQVTANDINPWAKTFGNCYILNTSPSGQYVKMIEHLNNVSPINGWLTEKYGGQPDPNTNVQIGTKKLWQLHNTMKADGIREEIEKISSDKIEKSVLVTSLILALDKVDNSLGHQASFLREWQPKTFKNLKLEIPKLIITPDIKHSVVQKDVFDLLSTNQKWDLTYFDPPYGGGNNKAKGTRVRYRSYYNIWTSICLNDKPKTFGIVNRRDDSHDETASVFENYRKNQNGVYIVEEAMERLLKIANTEFILLSYNNNGYISIDRIMEIISGNGWKVNIQAIDHRKNPMAFMYSTGQWLSTEIKGNKEFLFLVKK